MSDLKVWHRKVYIFYSMLFALRSMLFALCSLPYASCHHPFASVFFLRINAQSLKPQADYMGIAGLKDILVDIENKAASADKDKLSILFDNAYSIHSESEVILQDFVNTH